MTEKLGENFYFVQTQEDLVKAIPPSVVSELGGNEIGKGRFLDMVLSLSAFAPDPATLDRAAFDATVAIDGESGVFLGKETSDKMLQVAVDTGLLRESGDQKGRFSTNPAIPPLANRIFE